MKEKRKNKKEMKYIRILENYKSREEKEKIEDEAFAKIKRCYTWLYSKHPFYARNLSNLGIYMNWNLPYKTAATDYQNIYFDPEFALSLYDSELRFVIIHELLHVILLHGYQKGERDHKLWNKAADYALNDLIMQDTLYQDGNNDKISAPKDRKDGTFIGLWDIKYRGMTAKKIYDEILEEQKEGNGGQNQNQGGSSGQSKGDGSGSLQDLDENIDKSDVIEVKKGSGSDDGDDGKSGDEGEAKEIKIVDGEGEEGEEGEGESDKAVISKQDKEKFQEKVKRTFKASIAEGRGLNKNLKEILERMVFADDNKIDWQKELKNFVTKIQSDLKYVEYRRRHISQERYLSGYQQKSDPNAIDNLVIAIDNSGSIDREQIKAFISEVLAILKSYTVGKVTILYVDTEINSIDQFPGNKKPDYSKIKEGGGTDFHPPFKWLKDKNITPNLFIYFTDSYATYPKREYAGIVNYIKKIIWVIINNENYLKAEDKPPYGYSIFVPLKEFMKK